MNLLAGTYYDPAVAVTKATTALLAMTALDATNLRLTFTAPPSGRVKVVIRGGCIHGATTFPQVLVGCLESSPSEGTVRGRMPSQGGGFNGTAVATTQLPVGVEYIIAGLTPGQQYVWDVAYGVEVVIAATGWKYGGPNDTTANNAFGGISFEIWDVSPVYTPSSGAAPTSTVHAKLDAIDDFIDTEIDALATTAATIDARLDTEIPAMKSVLDTMYAVQPKRVMYSGYTEFAISEDRIQSNDLMWGTQNPIGATIAISPSSSPHISVEHYAVVTGYNNIDGTVDFSPAYWGVIPVGWHFQVQARDFDMVDALAAVAAVRAKTDQLAFTEANMVDANVQAVNDVALQGAGTTDDKWRPAA